VNTGIGRYSPEFLAAIQRGLTHINAVEAKTQPGGAFVWTPEELEQLEASAAYLGLYVLAAAVDARLARGHLRDCRGRVITHFDEWLRAVKKGEWENV
jgi:hypothetical protein